LKADVLPAETERWAMEACHRCLIYLGNLGMTLLGSQY